MSILYSADENCLCGGVNFDRNTNYGDVDSSKAAVCDMTAKINETAKIDLRTNNDTNNTKDSDIKNDNTKDTSTKDIKNGDTKDGKQTLKKPPITVANVHLALNKLDNNIEKRIVEFGAVSVKLFDLWQAKCDETTKNLSFMVCTQYLDVLQYFPAFLMLLRNELDISIMSNNKEAIVYYNAIFNDALYEVIPVVETPLILNGEMIQELTAKYNNRITNYSKIKKRQYQFAEGEIVGAKDKEGRWWHAKILAKLFYQGQNIYYVEFSHWGPEFNEWIAETRRICKYNPRRHVLYRPASMTKNKPLTVRNGDKINQKEDALDGKSADINVNDASEDECKLDELD